MKRLILLRHAKAVAREADDFDRVLAPRGRAEMTAIAAYLAAQPDRRPDLALVSAAVRTRETWTLAQAGTGEVATAFEDEVYEASPEQLLDVVHTADGILADGATETLILVGHNPGISELAQMLVASGESVARRELARGMPTGAVAILDIDIASWRELRPGTARLADFVTPDTAGSKRAV
jgi:phosphohistidine phosphatase